MTCRSLRFLLLGAGFAVLGDFAMVEGADAPTIVTAEQLMQEFATDSKAASQKYDGKTLQVEGIVSFSRENDSLLEKKKQCWVLLYGYKKPGKSESDRQGINCDFDPAGPLAAKAKALANGHKARITGKLKADARPELVECSAVERIPIVKEKAVKISPEELVKTFAKDKKGAADKYQFKVVEVSGVVADSRKAYVGDEHCIEVRAGANKLQFVFAPTDPAFAAAKKITAGKKVTLKGRVLVNTYDKPEIKDCAIVK